MYARHPPLVEISWFKQFKTTNKYEFPIISGQESWSQIHASKPSHFSDWLSKISVRVVSALALWGMFCMWVVSEGFEVYAGHNLEASRIQCSICRQRLTFFSLNTAKYFFQTCNYSTLCWKARQSPSSWPYCAHRIYWSTQKDILMLILL